MFLEAGSNETNGKRLVIMVTMTDVNLSEYAYRVGTTRDNYYGEILGNIF